MQKTIKGFSKLSKTDKIRWLVDTFMEGDGSILPEFEKYWIEDVDQQRVLDGFSENTITNYPMPFGVAPNFLIDGEVYCVPMVIEESSVVAAAAAAAKFWLSRGGFRATILGTKKIGQVHFKWQGDKQKLEAAMPMLTERLLADTEDITDRMRKRGGGVTDIELIDFTDQEPDLYQLKASFQTCDSMGANFINSCLETFAKTLELFFLQHPTFTDTEKDVLVVMSILSNYTPECLVRAEVSCPVEDLGKFAGGISAELFAEKFATAVRIATIDPYRATTHNKGIFNGIDAVVLATGNDFRAIEACGHAYASRNGQYASLSSCTVENGVFRFWMDLPLAVGTIGGLTSLHPIASISLRLLGSPTAEELMKVIAVTGLAQNFAALRSLVTTGIQKGHMKMHLLNILNAQGASPEQIDGAVEHFAERVVTYSAVRDFLGTS